jgi:hypothetical protein
MTATPATSRSFGPGLVAIPLAAVLLTLACSGGSKGDPGPTGPPGPGGGGPTPSTYDKEDPVPEVIVNVLEVGGATDPGGFFSVGDVLSVRFSLTKADGSVWLLSDMDDGIALVSGPTTNYNRVLHEDGEDPLAAVDNLDGSYTYTFGSALPAVYAAPDNDSPALGTDDGELTGTPLLEGTYTLGLSFAWDYNVDGRDYQRVGEATFDFLLGGSAVLQSREVVTRDNCNRCHVDLRGHDGRFRDVTTCLLCHTAGAEDENDPLLAGGTPGVGIDFRVMMHRLHNARHLPSALGVSTFPGLPPSSGGIGGTRDYGAAPGLVQYVRDGVVHDYTASSMPVMPTLSAPAPRDVGHSALTLGQQAVEDLMRAGLQQCNLCHGDPDGAGPLAEPAQGYNHAVTPSKRVCYACHDDVLPDRPYVANGQEMPAESDDSTCIGCHADTGDSLATIDGHLHPLLDAGFDTGIVVELLDATESGANDGDGTLDVGEELSVTFTIEDGTGAPVDPATLDAVKLAISGPSTSSNIVLSGEIPAELLVGPQPFTLDLPAVRYLEHVGDATGVLGDVFTTSGAPILPTASFPSVVSLHTGVTGTASTLTAAASPQQNFVDVADGTLFAVDDVIVIDDASGSLREWLKVQFVDGDRLWFSSPRTTGYKPGLDNAHAAGATVDVAALTPLLPFVDYLPDLGTGQLLELVEFGAGNSVLVDYLSDFRLPAVYPPALNSSDDLGETHGDWAGKPVVDGTYRVGIWAHRGLDWDVMGEITSYRSASPPATHDLLVGDALNLDPYAFLDSGDSCNQCHLDLAYHDGEDRGYDTCALCHAASGSADWPRYAAPFALDTPGLSVAGRNLFHVLHSGVELDDPAAFLTSTQGPGAYPFNFGVRVWTATFPAQPSRAKNCEHCHGASNDAWKVPADRRHPTLPAPQPNRWTQACGQCHDDASAQAHIAAETGPGGVESCSICHDANQEWNVEVMHTPR